VTLNITLETTDTKLHIHAFLN